MTEQQKVRPWAWLIIDGEGNWEISGSSDKEFQGENETDLISDYNMEDRLDGHARAVHRIELGEVSIPAGGPVAADAGEDQAPSLVAKLDDLTKRLKRATKALTLED